MEDLGFLSLFITQEEEKGHYPLGKPSASCNFRQKGTGKHYLKSSTEDHTQNKGVEEEFK
jgi:hypothetical protein